MDITEFVFKRNEKMLSELVTKTWQMVSAKEKVEARKVSRFDTVRSHLTLLKVVLPSGYSVTKKFFCSLEWTPTSF